MAISFENKKKKEKGIGRQVKLYAIGILIACILAFISDFFISSILPSGGGKSMDLTMQDRGNCLVVRYGIKIPFTNIWFHRTKPKRGDIVSIKPFHALIEIRGGKKRRLGITKRIIGLPGESIMIEDRRVYINGAILYEPYKFLKNPSPISGFSQRDNWEKPIIIPEGHYFVMGDNRDISLDSRSFGCVPCEFIKGKIILSFLLESILNTIDTM